MSTVIKIENLSKQYRLGLVGTGTLSHDLNRWWHLVRGKEDPYLKIGEINDRTTKGTSNYVWALKDINIEVVKGEILGIIGKNGAGKSTLLKILSKVTAPTTGRISYKGRIGSLLEVGTGFNPELTGRENLFLNGSILGMRKHEILRKFDEIVDFSGCERYIDTPVKRYSSGMMVRLGFAVAAFLEPEILVVDEVLAVGDAEFQKKAIGKMQDVSQNEGRTVLIVSHNLQSIQNLCTKCVVLKDGLIFYNGITHEAISEYLESSKKNQYEFIPKTSVKNGFKRCQILNYNNKNFIRYSEEIEIELDYFCNDYINNIAVGVAVLNTYGNKIFTTINRNIREKKGRLKLIIPNSTLLNGHYSFDIAIFQPSGVVFEYLRGVCDFDIIDDGSDYSIYGSADIGNVNIKCKWLEE